MIELTKPLTSQQTSLKSKNVIYAKRRLARPAVADETRSGVFKKIIKSQNFDLHHPFRDCFFILDIKDVDKEHNARRIIASMGGKTSDQLFESRVKNKVCCKLITDAPILPHLLKILQRSTKEQIVGAVESVRCDSKNSNLSLNNKFTKPVDSPPQTSFVYKRGKTMAQCFNNGSQNCAKSPLEQALSKATMLMKQAITLDVKMVNVDYFIYEAKKFADQCKEEISTKNGTHAPSKQYKLAQDSVVSSDARPKHLHGAFVFLGDLTDKHQPLVEKFANKPPFTLYLGCQESRTANSVFDFPNGIKASTQEHVVEDRSLPSTSGNSRYAYSLTRSSTTDTDITDNIENSIAVSPLNLRSIHSCCLCKTRFADARELFVHHQSAMHKACVSEMVRRRRIDDLLYTSHEGMPSLRWITPKYLELESVEKDDSVTRTPVQLEHLTDTTEPMLGQYPSLRNIEKRVKTRKRARS